MKVANKVTQVLVVRDDFSPTPGARKPHEGEFSGEDFRFGFGGEIGFGFRVRTTF